ncbi:Gfo/Idh/MocA family oxidoreductase [Sphingomonas parva]|uniref:Gfo/Idh/MocA family oxidoreductase n=1 Tax=Sphingomonas parva TaxID=2555898 RepID=A0A4Y8ZN36_9SPHN|nr:Gfo/Idh/MocA family oxidoreductase [Sphingomonas parva]TFI56575.1 Gfo/Idh/MocA family oxidoreductase [Sphingomonas parva]
MTRDPVRYAMIGGGEGAFIGPVHRIAAAIAGNCRLVAGALSSDAERARRSGEAIGLPPERSYASYDELLQGERERPAGERAEFVAIVTPNHVHAPAMIAALEAGFPVLCDKPLTDTLDAARAVEEAARRTGGLVGVTHTYTGYPMVRQARALVGSGELGAVRRVAVKYTQGWLGKQEDAVGKQAEWRIDPARSGLGGAFGDIGTHAFNLVEFITGERMSRLSAEIRAAVPGRSLDDDGAAMFHLEGGGRGTLVASQICTGDANGLEISVWCEEAGLHWRQEQPNSLRVARRGRPEEIWTPGADRTYLDETAMAVTRTPSGHPEGYLEAFANIYHDFAEAVRGRAPQRPVYAGLHDGIAGMRFIQAAYDSSARGGEWVDL